MNFFTALFAKPLEKTGELRFPTAEALHDETIPWVQNFKPWVAAMIVAVLIAYVPPLYEVVGGSQKKAVPYRPWSPAPE